MHAVGRARRAGCHRSAGVVAGRTAHRAARARRRPAACRAAARHPPARPRRRHTGSGSCCSSSGTGGGSGVGSSLVVIVRVLVRLARARVPRRRDRGRRDHDLRGRRGRRARASWQRRAAWRSARSRTYAAASRWCSAASARAIATSARACATSPRSFSISARAAARSARARSRSAFAGRDLGAAALDLALRLDLPDRLPGARLQVRAQAVRPVDHGERLRVRGRRRGVVAQLLEQRDALVDLAVTVRLAEDEHEQLDRGVVIDDRDRDAERRRALVGDHVERVRRVGGVQPLDELGIRDRVDRRVHGRHHVAARRRDVHRRGLRAAERAAICVVRRRAGPPGHPRGNTVVKPGARKRKHVSRARARARIGG